MAVVVDLSAVIIAITDDQPRVLTVPTACGWRGGPGKAKQVDGSEYRWGLPTGPLDPTGDRTLELALRRWAYASAGMELGYVEQLYTFADRYRDPQEISGGPRLATVAYLALVRETEPAADLAASWRSVYSFFPWEDWRGGRAAAVDELVAPAFRAWLEVAGGQAERARRRERVCIAFAGEGSRWDEERVLERYELLYELGLVEEAGQARPRSDEGGTPASSRVAIGEPMAHDHRRILAAALGRIRAKIKYRPVIFELMPAAFTLLELQRTVEALAGTRLHKQNFRRLLERGGLVEGTGAVRHDTGGRPAELFRFRREVLLERPAPGVGLPGSRRERQGMV